MTEPNSPEEEKAKELVDSFKSVTMKNGYADIITEHA